jgi:hypothetical protein
MGAKSVTGVSGPGESHGRYKPDNNCGCGCGCNKGKCDKPVSSPAKLGCYVRTRAQGIGAYKTGSSSSIQVC